ncbi:uncharacterized protein PWA37_004241 [Arxiozyma heterogenica]|uniref:uncharacterized protein n=1 Tax=Arxiozyma heterogenica TaxID=278026 RepID=UPI002F1B9884
MFKTAYLKYNIDTLLPNKLPNNHYYLSVVGLVEHTLVVKGVVDSDRDNTVAVAVVVGREVAVAVAVAVEIDNTDLVEEEALEYWIVDLFEYCWTNIV